MLNSDGLATNTGSKTTVDTTSPKPYPDHDLDILDVHLDHPRLYGSSMNADELGPGTELVGVVRGWRVGPVNLNLFPTLSSVNWLYYETRALAVLNPNRPVVDVPLFIFELREFPSMVRELGEFLRKGWRDPRHLSPKDAAKQHLAYGFGWAPLVSDILKLLDIAEQVERRKQLLLKAERLGGVRRKVKLGSTTFDAGTLLASSWIAACHAAEANWQFDGKEEGWATARLRLLTQLSGVSLESEAFRSVLGFNLPMYTIWNMLPWTWLLDYFSNLGDFMSSTGGHLAYKLDNINLMVHQNIQGKIAWSSIRPALKLAGGSYRCEYKGRRVVTLQLPWPLLFANPSIGQLSKLGSLVVSKVPRSLF